MIEKAALGCWLLAFGSLRKAKDSTAKDAKSAKERESNYQLTTGRASRFYDFDLSEGLDCGER
jgi:hypothetical protein